MFCYDPERPVADVETIYKFSSLVKKADYMDIFRTQSNIYDIELFVKVVHDFQSFLSLFSKGSILDVWIGSELTSGLCVEYI